MGHVTVKSCDGGVSGLPRNATAGGDLSYMFLAIREMSLAETASKRREERER